MRTQLSEKSRLQAVVFTVVVLPAAVRADADHVGVGATGDGAASAAVVLVAALAYSSPFAFAAGVLALVTVVVGVVSITAGERARVGERHCRVVSRVVAAAVDVGPRADVPAVGADWVAGVRAVDVAHQTSGGDVDVVEALVPRGAGCDLRVRIDVQKAFARAVRATRFCRGR